MNAQMSYLMKTYGFDQLTAWRHVRDREILRKKFEYQRPYMRKW